MSCCDCESSLPSADVIRVVNPVTALCSAFLLTAAFVTARSPLSFVSCCAGGDSPFSSGDAGIHLRNGPGISCDILFIRNIEDMEIIEIHCPALRKVVSWKLAVVVFVAFQSNVTSCQPELNGP